MEDNDVEMLDDFPSVKSRKSTSRKLSAPSDVFDSLKSKQSKKKKPKGLHVSSAQTTIRKRTKKGTASARKRSFRVISLDDSKQNFGYFHGTPSQAASKAATRAFHDGHGKSGKIVVGIKEITKGSNGKQSVYTVKRVKRTEAEKKKHGKGLLYKNIVYAGAKAKF